MVAERGSEAIEERWCRRVLAGMVRSVDSMASQHLRLPSIFQHFGYFQARPCLRRPQSTRVAVCAGRRRHRRPQSTRVVRESGVMRPARSAVVKEPLLRVDEYTFTPDERAVVKEPRLRVDEYTHTHRRIHTYIHTRTHTRDSHT